MKSKPTLLIALGGLVLVGTFAWWYPRYKTQTTPEKKTSNDSVQVEAVKVGWQWLGNDIQAVGSLNSRQSVVLRPEVSGRITRLTWKDGESVRKGQLLVQLDDQLAQAQVKQAEAELSIAQANHKRNTELVAKNFISQRSLDESSANLEVAQAKRSLALATAARLRIYAPFDGVTGIRRVNEGDYVKDGADVVNLEAIDTLFVDFRLPERYQTQVKKSQQASVQVESLPDKRFVATVQAIDPLIDVNARSLSVRACINNRDLQLRPGMFARVSLGLSAPRHALMVPEEALLPQGEKQSVLRLQDAKVTQRVQVKVGVRQRGWVEITEGLKDGDVVMTAGQQRIKADGTTVQVIKMAAPPTVEEPKAAAVAAAAVAAAC